jgi:hypothetical protein
MATPDSTGSTTPPDAAATGINQGATGSRPVGESPAASVAGDGDAYDERPEAFVGAAFIGGFALAVILKRVAR